MSNALTYDASAAAPAATPPDKGGRSILALVVLFVIVFAIAIGIQIKSHRDNAADTLLAAQSSRAALVAERVNANLAVAIGAASGVAELGRTTGDISANPQSIANAAAHARPAVAAAVVNRDGAIEAISDASKAAFVTAAVRSAGPAGVWVGAPDMGGLATAPALVRHVGDRAVVSILDPHLLLPDLDENARVLIAAPSGAILYASPALQGAGVRAQQQILNATRENGSALIRDGAGDTWVAAESPVQVGGFRVMAAAPAPGLIQLWIAAILRFAMVAAAPLAAMAVLYLMMRQNAQRAHIAEAEAERTETHFRIAADGAKVGVLEWRPGADELQLSEQAARLLGASKDTLALRELLELIVAEDRFGVEEEFRRARDSGLLDARFRVNREGGFAWVEARGASVEDAKGRVETRLFGTVVDATQRYEAEARVSRLERQLRAAIESFSGPFALWDARRRLLLWNQSFAKTFQLGPELLRPRASYEAISAASAARIRREKHDVADPDVRVIELTSGEWLHIVERRAADGGIITLGVDITPLKQKEEELAKNQHRLQKALTRAEAQEYRIKALAREAHSERLKAEDASRAKSAFLANMSHELRTPLNAVIGFSEIMAKELFGPLANPQYKQYSSDIFDSGNHLLDLINDILDMAKIEAGKLTLAPRPLDPAVAIDQAVRLTKRRAEEKGLQIVVDAEDLPEIEADHRAVKQMLLNLLSNAVKFTDEGAIMVHGRANAAGLTLRVIDTGCGIPPEHLPRLAQPFQQVEQELARNHSGTGLGLALTKSLAEMHGGKLSIQSEVGRGTIVTITLPRVFGGHREPPEAPSQDAAA
ncbi:PAS domain-containing sensor histidine kinase [Terricaulis sp.]|uniref:PAS domain-containing sensor histidine kinase n=1 Tax=Terricaulis sp. TaxID=2768686 RepID=UPI0037846975